MDMSEQNKDCGLARDLMPLVIDNVCGENSRKFLEEHLESCPECRAAYDKMKSPAPVQETPNEETAAEQEQKALAKSVKKTARRIRRRRILILLMIPVLLLTGILVAKEIHNRLMYVEKPLPMNTYDISLKKYQHYVAMNVNIYNAPGDYMWTQTHYEVITAQTENGLKRAAILTLMPTYCPHRSWGMEQGHIAAFSLFGHFPEMLYAEGDVLYTINDASYDYETHIQGNNFEMHATLGMPIAQIRVTDGTETHVLYNWGDTIPELTKDSIQFSRPYEVNTTSSSNSINNAVLWNTEVFITDEERAAFHIPEAETVTFSRVYINEPQATMAPFQMMPQPDTYLSPIPNQEADGSPTPETPLPDATETAEQTK